MNEFDLKAQEWDDNPMHWDRSKAIVTEIMRQIPLSGEMTALEYGAGTGITSFMLKYHLKEITMMDSSSEMVKIMNEKISASDTTNLKPVLFDLEKNQWEVPNFDLIISQMVLHHIADVKGIIEKFYSMLKPGGFIAIADLYPEDGSFHGPGFSGHKGFESAALTTMVYKIGFLNVSVRKCYVINKTISENKTGLFDVFLLTASKNN